MSFTEKVRPTDARGVISNHGPSKEYKRNKVEGQRPGAFSPALLAEKLPLYILCSTSDFIYKKSIFHS